MPCKVVLEDIGILNNQPSSSSNGYCDEKNININSEIQRIESETHKHMSESDPIDSSFLDEFFWPTFINQPYSSMQDVLIEAKCEGNEVNPIPVIITNREEEKSKKVLGPYSFGDKIIIPINMEVKIVNLNPLQFNVCLM